MKFSAVAPCAPSYCRTLALLTLVACLPWLGAQSAPAAQADLWQARNGTPTAPLDPVDWVKGNVGQANSHYVEGYSAPYRLVMSGLALGPHRVVIEWDTQQGGKHAIDYLTHYERMRPHNQFGAHDRPETVDPLAGLSGTFAAPRAFPAPLPSSSDSPVPGQPGKSFLDLPAAERVLTIWNGAITNAAYLQEGPLTSAAAAAQLAIEFVAESDTVVVAWGGHLATKTDWGAGFSAADISGSAYHMRKIELDGSGGNQDRSLQAVAVVSPPTCVINGPTSICTLATNVFAATSDDRVAGFIWTLTNNLAGALFVSATNQASVEVVATSPGTFTLQATAVDGMSQSACFFEVTVYATVAAGSLADQTVCDGSDVTFVIEASGTDLTYTWRKDGRVLPDAKTSTLILRDVHAADAGSYCVEIGGRCGQQTRCASLLVEALPMLACPDEVVRPCITELPGPDPALVRVLAGSAPVVVTFGGDVTNIQDGDVILTRTYQAVDACGQRTSCIQRLIARDRTPPQIDCPGDLIVREEPANSGFAAVVYSNPTVTDSCDPAPMVVCDPPSGAAFAVGDTLVQCRATDSAGNLGQCGFRVRVVPQTIVVTSLADSGPGSLRQAMLDANAAAGSNTIAFGFPGAAPYTIHLLSALPGVSDRLIIDGQSQATFAGSPVVELNGVAAQAAGGGAAGPIAAAAAAPAVDGLLLASGGTVVRGLVLYGFTFGIRVDGSSNNIIAGNIIGPDHTGTNPIGNRLDGILLTGGASDNRIGPDNLIAFNGRNGVGLDATAGSGNTVLSNRIVFNGGLPIDLGNDGPTPNDADDPDLGPNGLQNSPVLAQVRSDGFTQLIIPGTLQGPPFTLFRIDFFLEQLAPTGDPRDAQNPIGSIEVRTDASGLGRFEATFSFSARPGQYITATATDASGSTSEQAARSPVRTPPIILDPPHGVTTPLGAPAELCVEAIGTEPLFYQWRRNGANIADATNVCFIIGSAALSDGASYTVVVANELDAITSDPALVLLDLPQLKAGDNFADRVPLFGPAGMISFTNAAATREPGEPLHAGKPGEHSVWYSWTPPADGIATLRTVGSTFDTLLAVYLGNALTNLEEVAADEDRGGYFTSEIRLNAVGGLPYQIAVDGFGSAAGPFTFSWNLFVTDVQLPVITNQPVSQTVLPGGTAIFRVGAAAACHDGHHDCRHPEMEHHEHHNIDDDEVPIFYQWLLNGMPLAGATDPILTVINAQESDLGNYTVRVRVGTNAVESLTASLQLNVTGVGFEPVQAADKFLDVAVNSPPLHLGTPPGGGGENPFAAASIVRGYTGTQVFNTTGSTTEGELICGVLGGASEWISLVPEESGTLFLNTDGSSFDTVLAVFRRSATNASRLELVACDNDGGIDHHDSALQMTAQAGQTNFIVIDGVNGAHGTLRLNYSLVTPSALSLIGLVSQQPGRIRVVGHPSMRFTLQTSSNLVDWTLLLTTNSGPAIYEFIDPSSVNVARRYYRALMLP